MDLTDAVTVLDSLYQFRFQYQGMESGARFETLRFNHFSRVEREKLNGNSSRTPETQQDGSRQPPMLGGTSGGPCLASPGEALSPARWKTCWGEDQGARGAKKTGRKMPWSPATGANCQAIVRSTVLVSLFSFSLPFFSLSFFFACWLRNVERQSKSGDCASHAETMLKY